jgi:hypothetical protein
MSPHGLVGKGLSLRQLIAGYRETLRCDGGACSPCDHSREEAGETILHGLILDGKASTSIDGVSVPIMYGQVRDLRRRRVGKDWGFSSPKGTKDSFQACLIHQLEAMVHGVSLAT